jgi:hypothetical protein
MQLLTKGVRGGWTYQGSNSIEVRINYDAFQGVIFQANWALPLQYKLINEKKWQA